MAPARLTRKGKGVDDLNPTGYSQVVEELSAAGAVERTYTYGLQRISEYQPISNVWTASYYGYDGMGSVRQLTNTGGAVTDQYEYDADGNMKWQHTNVWAAGKILATYQVASLPNPGNPSNPLQTSTLHFYLDDPLGSRRVQTDYAGVVEQTCTSLPYGDGESCAPSPTEHLFTGKERDTESGNDYFGARYYASSMGRFLSPDPINLTEERLLNPANTLNKYAYAANNPLKYVDPDGEDVTYFYDQGGIAGHAMLFAYNQATGDSAIEDFGPTKHMPVWWGNSMHETPTFTSADDIRHNTAALTIQTTPELAQQVIDYIRSHPDPATWTCLGKQCSSQVWKILQKFKLDNQNTKENQGASPAVLWNNLMSRYNGTANSAFYIPPTNGRDYGRPRFDMFQLFWQSLPQAQPKEHVTHKICDADRKNCH